MSQSRKNDSWENIKLALWFDPKKKDEKEKTMTETDSESSGRLSRAENDAILSQIEEKTKQLRIWLSIFTTGLITGFIFYRIHFFFYQRYI